MVSWLLLTGGSVSKSLWVVSWSTSSKLMLNELSSSASSSQLTWMELLLTLSSSKLTWRELSFTSLSIVTSKSSSRLIESSRSRGDWLDEVLIGVEVNGCVQRDQGLENEGSGFHGGTQLLLWSWRSSASPVSLASHCVPHVVNFFSGSRCSALANVASVQINWDSVQLGEETWFAEGSVSSFGEEGEAVREVDIESPVFSFKTEHEDFSCSKDSKWVFSRRVFKTYDEMQNVRC